MCYLFRLSYNLSLLGFLCALKSECAPTIVDCRSGKGCDCNKFIPLKLYFTKALTGNICGRHDVMRVIYISPSLEAVQVTAMQARLKFEFSVEC